MPARAEKDTSAKMKIIADIAAKFAYKDPIEFDEEDFMHRLCKTAEKSALTHLVSVFRCATTEQSIQLYTTLVRDERQRRKDDTKEAKALEEVVAQDQYYIAEMVKIVCGTAAPSLKESNGYSRERLLGAAGARQLPMSGFALAALAVRELDQADATAAASLAPLMQWPFLRQATPKRRVQNVAIDTQQLGHACSWRTFNDSSIRARHLREC